MTSTRKAKTHEAITREGSALRKYQDVVVGSRSLWRTVRFELCAWLSAIPGAAGLFLRKIFWPGLFGSCGSGVQFGANVVLRHPGRIHLGERVVISEGCILDARNEGSDRVIVIGDDVILSNDVMISCKGGSVAIGSNVGIGAQTIIQSTNDCPVEVGSDVMIGPRCYLVGGGSYHIDRLDIPMWRQGIRKDGGVRLADDIWLGSGVSVLGGVEMGSGSVAAAGALVTKSIPERAVCMGQPARVTRTRGGTDPA
jgi:acetyltransferase-like isoleucine patch superfamily enzyme